jgi:dipeptidyl aminopeptidase/acylaminoacyl peptidase
MLRWTRRILLAAVAGLIVFSFVVSATVSEATLHPLLRRRASDTAALAYSLAHAANGSARQITLTARDGTVLKAWWLQPPHWNGSAVIACHGVADSAFGIMGGALLFLSNGYAVLTPDSRGHGESGGFVSYGVQEADDILRWLEWLRQAHAVRVYGFGESLGAAILLQSLSRGANFRAIVAESSYANFNQVARERVVKYGGAPAWLANIFVHEAVLYVRLRYRVDLSKANPAEAVRGSSVPLLLIHGLDDRETYPIHSREIYRNSRSAQLWLVPAAKHTGAYAAAPREFERRVISFLEANGAS